MRLNAAVMCCALPALATAILGGSFGCSGGDGVPLGGPFGGAVPSGVMDAGAETDGDGVLDAAAQTSGSASGSSSQAPTWTQLFNAYFAVGKVGNCALSGCHGSYMTSPTAAFSWLQTEKQLGGSQPALANPNSSCLTWLGGDMPPGGPGAEPSAVTDLDLWLKAGAKNN